MYKLVLRFARRLNLKPGKEGIMQISSNQEAIDTANDILTKFKRHGVPNEIIKTENDVKVIYNQIKNIEDRALQHRVISPGDPRHKEITDRIFGRQTGDVVDMTGKKIDTSKPISGGKQVDEAEKDIAHIQESMDDLDAAVAEADAFSFVDETIEKMHKMTPLEALYEANKVIGRKGKYKKLTIEQSQEILKKTDDHIFERYADVDPEDFAHGGRTGTGLNYLLGEDDQNSRMPFFAGKAAKINKVIKKVRKPKVKRKTELQKIQDYGRREMEYTNPESLFYDERRVLQEKYPGITDNILDMILVDDNPQRKAEILATIDEAFRMLEKGKGHKEIIETFKSTPRTKQAEGGLTQKDFNQFLEERKKMQKEKEKKDLIDEWDKFKKWKETEGGTINFAAEGGRIGLKDGHSPGRRKFLKVAAGLASIPVVGKFFKWAKPAAKAAKVADLTTVPIGNPPGMPSWFKPLVNRVISEGDDVTKKLATSERQIVHKKRLGDPEDVYADDITVTQNLDNGNVSVEYHSATNMGEAPIQLDYKASEWIEAPMSKGQTQGVKTTEEFTAVEAEPRVANWDGDIEWDGENVVSKIDDLLTDTTKLESYATGKKPNIKKLVESEKKQKRVNRLHEDQGNQIDYIETKYGPGPDPTDFDDWPGPEYASGGRVPLAGGSSPMHGNYSVDEILEFKKQLIENGYSAGEANDYVRWLLKKNKMFEFPSVGFSSGGLAGMLGE